MRYLVFVFLAFTGSLLLAQSEEPILRLNLGVHAGVIQRIATAESGKYILTSSKDKTAKLWDAQTGSLLRTFRVPIGDGDAGMIYSGAIHPSEDQVAIGGWSENYNHSIYIFSTQSGRLLRRIEGHRNVVNDLEFDPSGRYLAAALGGDGGVKIYRTNTYSLFREDTDYNGPTYGVAFSSNGNLASVCYDGHLRLYNSEFQLIKKNNDLSGKMPCTVDISAGSEHIAVSYIDVLSVDVFDGTTLNLDYQPDLSGINEEYGRLIAVGFSIDGSQLVAGGSHGKYIDGRWWWSLRVWENKGRGSYRDYPAGNATIMDLNVLPEDKVLYAAGGQSWGVYSCVGNHQFILSEAAGYRFGLRDRSHFKVSSDGYEFSIQPSNENPVRFYMGRRETKSGATNYPSYKDEHGDLKISNWDNRKALKINGEEPSFLSASESAKSVDISDDGTRIVIGASWHIYGLDNKGQEIWSTTTQSEVWVVNITSDGNLVVAACSDGTIRWYRMNDGELLLSLFMHSDRKRWVVWTPEGYYDAAPGAEYLLGWHVNQGQDRAALFYPISRFRYQYYRPDVIDRVLETLDVAEAVQQADEIAQRFGGSRTRDIAAELPPSITILDPAPGASTSSNQVTINYSIQSPNGEEVTGVKALVNGRPVSETRGLKAKGLRGSLQIDIPSADCVISVLAENRFGSSEPAQVRLKWTGSTMATADLYKPNLYVLAIGVSEYETAELQLDFAAKDAQDFNTTINKQGGSLYSSVETRLLTDANATRANILEGLEWIVKETTQHDIAMIFFAGHGRETTRGTFYYVPVEADLTDRSLRVNGIMREDIKETVATIAGKVIVFIDACHSGSLMETSRRRGAPDMTRIINELTDAENGAVVFSSSSARQFSLEDQGWQNGAFTKALVEGLNGSAARPDGAITWKSLDNYITRRVKELTGGEQAPTTNVPPNTEDYPLAVDPK